MSVTCGFCIKLTDRERWSCLNSECARKHTTFYSMIVLVLVDWIKPWPEVQCHGQETIRCCGDSGDSHLGVASCMSSSETAVKRSAFALAGLMTCSAQGSCGSHWCWWLKSSSELSDLCAFSFLPLVNGNFPVASDSMPKLPEGYPFLGNKQSCVGGSRAKSKGLHLDFLWT